MRGGLLSEGACSIFWKMPSASLAFCLIAWASALGILFAALVASQAAQAHGIAGNRFFPGTLTFDDPAVADEAVLPNFSNFDHPDGGGDVTDNRINWTFTRLLTPTVGAVIDSSWIARNWGATERYGFGCLGSGTSDREYLIQPGF
jgi:hypothetical protein